MRSVIATAAAAAIIALSTIGARAADQAAPPSITVSGTGSVHYSPDIARVSLGVRGESTTAAAAAKSVNARAQAVIDGMRALGIADSNIATSGYSIEYQPPQESDQQPQPAPGQAQPMSIIRKPMPQGTYVATETIDIKTTIVKAGAARLAVIHDAGPSRGRLERMRRRFAGAHADGDVDAVVFGHSHIPLHERAADGFQIFNPGSPTERRRAPGHTMGICRTVGGTLMFELVELD